MSLVSPLLPSSFPTLSWQHRKLQPFRRSIPMMAQIYSGTSKVQKVDAVDTGQWGSRLREECWSDWLIQFTSRADFCHRNSVHAVCRSLYFDELVKSAWWLVDWIERWFFWFQIPQPEDTTHFGLCVARFFKLESICSLRHWAANSRKKNNRPLVAFLANLFFNDLTFSVNFHSVLKELCVINLCLNLTDTYISRNGTIIMED